MLCQSARNLLSAALDRELSGRDGSRLDAHLAACVACAAYKSELDRQHGTLRATLAQPLAVPAELQSRVLTRVQGLQPHSMGHAVPPARPAPSLRRLAFPALKPVLAVAALVLLALGANRWLIAHSLHVEALLGHPQVMLASSGGWQPLHAGLRLSGGERFRTARGEEVTVQWPDGTTARLGAQTQGRVAPARDGMAIQSGRVFASVAHQKVGFHVSGPAATATVLGTQFSVMVAHGGRTTLLVYRGRVKFANSRGIQIVLPWRSSVALAGHAPSTPRITSPLAPDSLWWVRRPGS